MEELKSQEEEFVEYLEGYKKLIAKVARIYCNDAEDRRDLIQDIIIQLWKSFPRYNKNYSISTWTYRIAINVSISHLRKASGRMISRNDYLQNVELMQADDTPMDEQLEKLYRFIDLLKPINKAIIILHLEGCPTKEISEVMGMSVTNVSTRKLRIKEELKTYFETYK